jgi:hypothetical protein
VWAFAWLSCQVASLSALLPAECCMAHHTLAESTEPCHESTPAESCPMRAVDGQACPMHTGAAHHDAAAQQNAEEQCAMRGTCNGPAVALAGLFAIPGVLVSQSQVRIDATSSMLTLMPLRFASTLSPLDTPPPRS